MVVSISIRIMQQNNRSFGRVVVFPTLFFSLEDLASKESLLDLS